MTRPTNIEEVAVPTLIEAIDQGLPALIAQNDRLPGFSRSAWLFGQEGKIFLRAGKRLLDPSIGGLTSVIDMASIELEEDYRARGIWSRVLARLEEHAAGSGRAVFVENVFSHEIDGSLNRRGYKSNADEDGPASYWKTNEDLLAAPIRPEKKPSIKKHGL